MSAPAINRGPTRRATRHTYKSQDGLPPEQVPPVTAMRHARRSPELLAEFGVWQAAQQRSRAVYHGDSVHARQRINGRWVR